MKQKNKALLIKYLVCFGVASLIAVTIFAMEGFFTDNVAVNIQILSDGFSISGVLLLAFTGMMFISGEGAFIGIGFVLKTVVQTFIPFGRNRHEFYKDYRERKLGEIKKSTDHCTVVFVGDDPRIPRFIPSGHVRIPGTVETVGVTEIETVVFQYRTSAHDPNSTHGVGKIVVADDSPLMIEIRQMHEIKLSSGKLKFLILFKFDKGIGNFKFSRRTVESKFYDGDILRGFFQSDDIFTFGLFGIQISFIVFDFHFFCLENFITAFFIDEAVAVMRDDIDGFEPGQFFAQVHSRHMVVTHKVAVKAG